MKLSVTPADELVADTSSKCELNFGLFDASEVDDVIVNESDLVVIFASVDVTVPVLFEAETTILDCEAVPNNSEVSCDVCKLDSAVTTVVKLKYGLVLNK